MGSLFLTFFSSFRVPKGQKTPIIPLEAIQTFLFHPKEPRKKSVHRRLTLAFLPTPQGRGPEGQKPNFARSDGGTRKMEALSELSPSFTFHSLRAPVPLGTPAPKTKGTASLKMVQVQSILKVADNSGAINVQCIRILEKSRAVTASVGDLITVSVKKVRPRKRIQKKDVCIAVVLRTKKVYVRKNGFKVSLGENSCALLTNRKDKTPVGTRIFGVVPVRELRKAKIMKCILLARSTL